MEHVSLYRKWRPQDFNEVIGQSHVTNTLANAISSKRIVHAYLFCGPRGTGKTSTARILAKAINCEEGPTATPCNSCEACTSISEGTALDVIEIDAASNRKIDEIRDLLEKIPYAPTALRSKVYIVDEVHQLTSEASSALLKTLEEPPGHVVFVLATTEPHKILPTIISRCQRFDFSLVATPEISGLLGQIAGSEGIEIEPEALGMIAEHARGSVRDAIGVMDQIAGLSGEKVDQHQLAEMIGEVESELVFEMVNMIAERDTPGALALVGRMVDSGKDPRRFVEAVISHLRSLFLVQNAAKPEEIVGATEEHLLRLKEQAGRLRRYEVVRLMEKLGETHREMRWSENSRLALECALVKATRTDVDISLEGIMFRLDGLEKKIEELGEGRPAEPAERSKAAAGKTGKKAERRKPAEPVRKREAPEAEAEEEVAGEVPEPKAGTATVDDKERARRAWVAVLAELKKQGHMRTYALLTKARIKDALGGKVVLGFPTEASFQLEVLSESGDIARVEEIWSRFMEEPVSLALEGLEGAKPSKGGAEGEPGAKGAQKEMVSEERTPERKRAQAGKKEKRADVRESEGGWSEDDTGEGVAGSTELAQKLKERFDGEIIEGNEKGKG